MCVADLRHIFMTYWWYIVALVSTIPSSQPLAVTVKPCRRDTLPVQLTMSLAYPTPGIPADAKWCKMHWHKSEKKCQKLQSHLALSKKEGQLSGGTVPQGSTFKEHPILERQQEAEQLCRAKVPFGRWKSLRLVHDISSSSSSSSSSPSVSSSLHHHRQASHAFCISSHALFNILRSEPLHPSCLPCWNSLCHSSIPHRCWRSRKVETIHNDCIHPQRYRSGIADTLFTLVIKGIVKMILAPGSSKRLISRPDAWTHSS